MTKRGGYALFKIAVAAARSKFLSCFLILHWFYNDPTNLGLQPGLSLTKNVRTPNSVWGKTDKFEIVKIELGPI